MLSIYNKYFFLLFVLTSCWPVSGLFAQQFSKGKTDFSDETPPIYTSESVLNKGNWLKLSIIESGIYKISYNDLVGFGLNPDNIDPRKIGIYFNGNGTLPEANGESRYDDLYENDIYISGQEDGAFNTNDYILFYGISPIKWKYNVFTARFDHAINPYTDSTFYFLCVDQQTNGKRIASVASSNGQPTKHFNQFLDYQYHEMDLTNLILSGRQWYGEEFSINDASKQFNFTFPDLVTDRKAHVRAEFVARSIVEDVYLSLKANDVTLIDSVLFAKLSADSQIHGRESNKNVEFISNSETIQIVIPFGASEGSSRAWLNYLRLNAWRWLIYRNEPLFFRNPDSKGNGAISTFSVAGTNPNLNLWDITDPLKPAVQLYNIIDDSLKFTTETDTMREYVLFSDQQTKEIINFQHIQPQNLHAISNCEMLIITDIQFINEANEIKQLHWDDDGLESEVVGIRQIYNEFACGTPDVTAVRDFIRMVYNKSNHTLKYVLLFGDASYDYRDRLSGNTNFVPTYQSTNSLVDTRSFLSDDYFGLMDYTEGEGMIGSLDLGIGRLPVSTVEDARLMVQKIRSYLNKNNENMSEWRNNITFIADDGNGNLHLDQVETLSKQIDTARFEMNLVKIYTDAYKRISVTGGFQFPDATSTLLENIDEGALIINYTGHGGINGLTDERLFNISDISSLTNAEKMPFFITATCEFSRFDNPKFVSAGERLLMQPNGGAIAMMTTTRLAFSHSNFALNRKLYSAIFDRTDVQMKRLGDIIRIAKSPSNENINNFTLLGDPALRLNYPSKKIITTKFNGEIPLRETDTVHAMSSVSIEGEIVDSEGIKITDFNGYLDIKMFDKKTNYRTLANDQTSNAVNFNYFSKMLYRGKVTVKNGEFSANFLLPKDLSFNYGKAKISYYAVDTSTYDDATGVFGNLIVGGTDESITIDQVGPEIEMYINNSDFVSGDIILPNPVLFARISDPQGVNYLGTSIGRDIVLTLNDQSSGAVIINSYYTPEIDNFTTGTITYNLNDLPVGSYTLELKAWDLHNNPSTKSIDFVIETFDKLILTNVFNYPNPFRGETSFTFRHNQQDGLFDVVIDIYTISGKWVTTLSTNVESVNQESLPIYWNGKDHNGKPISTGSYVYSIQITDAEKRLTVVNQKFVYFR